MRTMRWPQCNDTVHYFVTFAGDDQVSGPYTALVVGVGSAIAPGGVPDLDLLVEYPASYERRPSVPHATGREYWVATPT